jgi:hypothetical protein
MKKLFRLLFPKYEVHHVSFHTGTNGMKRHRDFIETVNKENIEIINSYITYHRDNLHSHKPESINYVIKILK